MNDAVIHSLEEEIRYLRSLLDENGIAYDFGTFCKRKEEEMDFGRSEEEFEHGFGVEVKISGQLPLPLCITPEIVNKAGMLHVKMLKVYNEIVTDAPFPAWKTGLDEVWEP